MKILLINNYHEKLGGAEAVFLNTIDLLSNKGHDVYTLTMDHNHDKMESKKKYYVNSKGILHNQFYSFEAKRMVRDIVSEIKPDIAHVHNIIGRLTFSVAVQLKKMNIPVLASIHDFRLLCPVYSFIDRKGEICEKCINGNYFNCIVNNCSQSGQLKSIIIALESFYRNNFLPYTKYYDHLLFVSDFYKKKFVSLNASLEAKCDRLYNFTINHQLSTERGDYFLYIGRLVRTKGLMTLVAAFAENPKHKLKIAGWGELAPVIEEMGLKNIELLGYKKGDELNELIKGCSFVVVPSELYENNPMSLVESFSFGKPVIGTNIGGITELIDEGKNGFLFTPGIAGELSEKLIKSVNLSNDDYRTLSLNSFNFALKYFSPEIYYQQLIDIYKKLVKS